ncbi:DUF4412 domain-containing protein [Christiangramia sp. SM2212]|uniref:DUF4412 domain-containing protein n=1 Tax=Christiangramia sediminicola TaxID=3073267 RepID=A0ABU1EPH3_9FLAO|nr:DUF4412 domain-containing protein [Christiangramia sp. SM2212]MDR5590295.1 DUF4412 domain-containing protein [Christiangramia sp. SM2212]
MKIKILLLFFVLIGLGQNAEAQLLKKLKNKAENAAEKVLLKKTEKKAEQMTEAAFDSLANNSKNRNFEGVSSPSPIKKNSGTIDYDTTAMHINTPAKRDFYSMDVVVTTAENNNAGSSFFFDADHLAMRGISPEKNSEMYTDSEGFQYAFNDSNNRWEKTGLMRSDAMSFMMPAMSMSLLQLPSGPMLAATEKAKAQGMSLNTFMIVEWAFIYRPEHFRNQDYIESDTSEGLRFNYTDPDYSGSYVLFDEKNRLSKAIINVKTPEGIKSGSYDFKYQPVEVNIPKAVEVKMPFQDLIMAGADANPPGTSSNTTQNSDYETAESQGTSHAEVKTMTENLKNSDLGSEDLPESYDFDWQYRLKMLMPNQKGDPQDLVFLLKNNSNYQGVSVENKESGSINDATMVFDINLNAMVMFVHTDTNKILQIHPIKQPKAIENNDDLKVREIPEKTIIGYNCKGLEIESDKFIVQVYHTTEAPVKMSNLFKLSGPMELNIPEIDHRLVEQFSEGLITELRYTDKKKSKNDVLLTAQSIQQKKTSFRKNEYQNMSFLGQLKSMKN